MRIAICDDEIIFVNVIDDYLKKYIDQENDTVEKFTSGEDLVDQYNLNKKFDLIFLDCKMKKMNGIEAAREIRKTDIDVEIIFVSALIGFATEGYEVNARRYIVKPASEEAVKKNYFEVAKQLEERANKNYIIKTKNEIIKINRNEIFYIESKLRKIEIHTAKEKFETYSKIKEEELELRKHKFFRAHKSFLVNLNNVKSVGQKDIKLEDGRIIPLSKQYRQEFIVAFYINIVDQL